MPISAALILEAAERWGLSDATVAVADKLASYGNLLLQWNTRLSLTSIRNEVELIERHLLEGVFAAANHPPSMSALDFGSGTGIPGIAIALCRPELVVTLAESQKKKAAFLKEAVRQLQLDSTVHADRAEGLPERSFGAVWMRAVDKSAAMLPLAATLVAPSGTLCLLGTAEPPKILSGAKWVWETRPLPGANIRVLHIGVRV